MENFIENTKYWFCNISGAFNDFFFATNVQAIANIDQAVIYYEDAS